MTRYIDSHTHLFFPEFQKDLEDVLQRAREAGVGAFVVPGTNLETSRQAIELADRFDDVYACVGIHPLDAAGANDAALRAIEEISRHPRVVAIGEIGLDYFYDTTPQEVQRGVFAAQLSMAASRDLPVVIHTRNSLDDAKRLVEATVSANPAWRSTLLTPHSRFPAWKGVFHCFSGDATDARKLLALGFIASFPGILTFKKSGAFETLRTLGYDHVMLETDAPFLAPAPHRGKRNEPAFIPLIAARAAEACGATLEDIARTTTYNAKRLFGFGEADPPVFAYKLGNSLYLNLTIRCDADCIFCDRRGEAFVKGHNLKIIREPDAGEVIAEIADPTRYDEIVFCGYGEPTIRLDAVKEISAWVKQHGGRTRLNTDGHGNIINKRNIAPELSGLIDSVSISLNSPDPVQYGELMQLDGGKYFAAMVEFAREAKKHVPDVVMTVVDMNEVDREKARLFTENELGVRFRVRPYF